MSQHLTHGGLPKGMTRWQFFGLIERARRQLGLSKGAISYLKVAISNTTDEDFLAGRICSFWTSVTKIAAQAGLDRRQIARIEAWLIANGFLVKTASDHSRRAGSRKNGKIGHEFGINLAPLIARATEIRAASRKADFEVEESERLRNRIKKLFGDIRRLQDQNATTAADQVLPNRRPSTVQNFERLQQIAEALEAVWNDFSSDSGRGEKSHRCDISAPPNIPRRKKYKTCRGSERLSQKHLQTVPAQVALLATDELRNGIEQYWQAFDAGGAISWKTIHLAARDRARKIGISERAWLRQCEQLGATRAALSLMIVDRNSKRLDAFHVRNVAAAFAGMAEQHCRDGAVAR